MCSSCNSFSAGPFAHDAADDAAHGTALAFGHPLHCVPNVRIENDGDRRSTLLRIIHVMTSEFHMRTMTFTA
jgi:hypothetical protein